MKGTCGTYNETDTEVVLRFLEPLEKGKYALAFDLHSSSYEKSSFLRFILGGCRWRYISRNFYGGIKKEDNEFIVECQRIEFWIVPPYGGILWQFEPDKNYLRFTEMTKEAVTILQNDYKIPEPGPPGRIAFQWEEKRKFGNGGPSMMSKIECYFALGSPLVLIFSIGGFVGFIMAILALLL